MVCKIVGTLQLHQLSGAENEAAYVRWLVAKRLAVKDKKDAKNLVLMRLKWEEEKGRNSSANIVVVQHSGSVLCAA